VGLNIQKGNMYSWVTHTWNCIKGACPHDCSYCYMKIYKLNPVRFDTKELKTDMGNGNTIFVGSSCDTFAEDIPDEWIDLMLEHLRMYPDNTYLIQSKNPKRIIDWEVDLPPRFIIGTTIESNRCCCDWTPKAPCTSQRYLAMLDIDLPKMVSIEPIMDFDLDIFAEWIVDIAPDFVSIGADSKWHDLPEPDGNKLRSFIDAISEFTEIKAKNNLSRLLK